MEVGNLPPKFRPSYTHRRHNFILSPCILGFFDHIDSTYSIVVYYFNNWFCRKISTGKKLLCL